MEYQAVLSFWFEELTPAQWWKKDEQFDAVIAERFSHYYRSASLGELAHWRDSPAGRLAEIIVLDQFSRNMFRDTAQAFATDGQALVLAQEAIRAGADTVLSEVQRSFLYMPFMHSESLAIQDRSIELFTALGLEGNLKFAHAHRDIIVQFGRYPHRNQMLWRDSTEEEMAFLEGPNSSF
ncbi:MAG: DUF924 family protein [Pseudomonadales bacterium]